MPLCNQMPLLQCSEKRLRQVQEPGSSQNLREYVLFRMSLKGPKRLKNMVSHFVDFKLDVCCSWKLSMYYLCISSSNLIRYRPVYSLPKCRSVLTRNNSTSAKSTKLGLQMYGRKVDSWAHWLMQQEKWSFAQKSLSDFPSFECKMRMAFYSGRKRQRSCVKSSVPI